MKIKNFLLNIVKIAKAPSVSNVPPLEVDAADMKEIVAWLEEENAPHNVASEQEVQFRFDNVNFMVIENDRGDEVGLGGITVEPQKWVADGLSKEDQAIVERNTIRGEASIPIGAPTDAIEEIRKDSIPQATQSVEEQQKPLEKDLAKQEKETAANTPVKPIALPAESKKSNPPKDTKDTK